MKKKKKKKKTYLTKQNDKASEVEDVDHPDQPVNKHGGARGCRERGQSKSINQSHSWFYFTRHNGKNILICCRPDTKAEVRRAL